MITANKLNKEVLDAYVGYLCEIVAVGEDQVGNRKMVEYYHHPMTKESFWYVKDSRASTKYSEWNDAVAAYNNL